jgi:hypothetical protein
MRRRISPKESKLPPGSISENDRTSALNGASGFIGLKNYKHAASSEVLQTLCQRTEEDYITTNLTADWQPSAKTPARFVITEDRFLLFRASRFLSEARAKEKGR